MARKQKQDTKQTEETTPVQDTVAETAPEMDIPDHDTLVQMYKSGKFGAKAQTQLAAQKVVKNAADAISAAVKAATGKELRKLSMRIEDGEVTIRILRLRQRSAASGAEDGTENSEDDAE